MAEMLKFKKGLHANLPTTPVAGTVYVTTDEQAMYVDISNEKRIRLGQIVNFPTLAKFKEHLDTTIPPYSTEAFYYIEDKNALLKWVNSNSETSVGGESTKGTWVQINSTQAVSDAINGLSNRVSSLENAIGNETSGIIKSIADNAAAIEALQEEISGEGENSLTNRIAATEGRITTAEGKITTAEGKITTAEGKITALENTTSAQGNTIAGHTTAIEGLQTSLNEYKTEVGNTYSTKEELNTAKTDISKEISDAVAAETSAREQADLAINNSVSAAQTAAGNAQAAAEEAQATADDALELIGNDSTGLIKDIKDRLKISDFEIFKIENNEAIQDVADAASAAQNTANAANSAVAERLKISDFNTFKEANTENIADAKKAGTDAQGALNEYVEAHKNDYTNEKINELVNGVSGSASANANAINTLSEKLETYKGTVENTYAKKGDSYLKSETYTKQEVDAAIDADVLVETNRAKEAEKANSDAISALNGIVATLTGENGLVAKAQAAADKAQGDIDTWKENHQNDYTNTQIDDKVADAKKAGTDAQKTANANANSISALQGTVGTLTGEDTVAGSVKQQIKAAKEALSAEIDADIRAANAMEFVEGISASTDLPTSAKNGATYVAEAAFTLDNGERVLPGDLLIAEGTEDATTGLITNPTWALVHTGYDATLEQTLDTVDGKIQLTSKVGGTASEIAFAAAEGSATTVSVANNTVTVGIEWDTF